MTPLATPRRLRRHGRAVALTTAAAALVGIAGASMAFHVDQGGTAAAAATQSVAPQGSAAPVLAPPLPDLTAVGERIAQEVEDTDRTSESGDVSSIDPGGDLVDVVPDAVTGVVPDLTPLVPPADEPAPAVEEPAPAPVTDLVESLPVAPLLGPDAALPVDDVVEPVLGALDDVVSAVPVVPTLADELTQAAETLSEPLCEGVDAITQVIVEGLEPLPPTDAHAEDEAAFDDACLDAVAPVLPTDTDVEQVVAVPVSRPPALLEPVRTGLLGG